MIELSNGAEISASTLGSLGGDAGNLTVEGAAPGMRAERVTLRGGPGGLSQILARGDEGNGGNLGLRAARLELVDGGQITVSTSGRGDAGELSIDATEVLITGLHPGGSSGVFAQTLSGQLDSGDAGNATLTVSDSLNLRDGGVILVESRSGGSAGSIAIRGGGTVQLDDGGKLSARVLDTNAPEPANIEIRDMASVRLSSGSTITAETNGTGVGGNIDIAAGEVSLSGGSEITARSTSRRVDAGDAGDVSVEATTLTLLGDSKIRTDAESAGGGGISLQGMEIVRLTDSDVTTDVRGANALSDAGNIDIPDSLAQKAGVVPKIVVLNRSSITANAVVADAGNILIAAKNYIKSADSVVEANSKLGEPGEILISAPAPELVGQLTSLPTQFVDVSSLLTTPCGARTAREGSFVVQSRGPIPPAPSGRLTAGIGLEPGEAEIFGSTRLELGDCPVQEEIR